MKSRVYLRLTGLVAFLLMGCIMINLIETVGRIFYDEVIESGLGWNAPADMLIAFSVVMLCFIGAFLGAACLFIKVLFLSSKKSK